MPELYRPTPVPGPRARPGASTFPRLANPARRPPVADPTPAIAGPVAGPSNGSLPARTKVRAADDDRITTGASPAWCARARRGPGASVGFVTLMRRCSRTACQRPAVATLTYVYADSTAVLGPLATFAEPHTYDLCGQHAERLTAPRGWEVVRLLDRFDDIPVQEDDLLAVADALRDQTVRDRTARTARQGASDGSGGTGFPQEEYGTRRRAAATGRAERPGSRAEWNDARGSDRRARLRVLRETSARSVDL